MLYPSESLAGSIDRDALDEQIERLLKSSEFDGKDQLQRLLRFLFERIDAQAILKPARVIEELWPLHGGKKTSSDLATVMSRLRRAVDAYYDSTGRADPIRIHLPNRATPPLNGLRGNRWITAELRDEGRFQPPLVEPKLETGVAASPAVLGATADSKRRTWKLAVMASMVVGLAVSAAIGLSVMQQDGRPEGARIEGSVFTVLNGKGRELWHKSFPLGFWQDYYQQGIATRTWFGNLNGSARSEVLFLYHPSVNPRSRSTTLICYSDRGEELWRWTPGKALAEISDSPNVYETLAFAVTRPKGNSGARIVLSSYHLPYYPNQIAILDASGRLVSEYWHSGHLDYMILADLDGDGNEEILASGIANGYRQATLVVLELDHVFGASLEPARPEVQLHRMGSPRERLRILFPRSDLSRTLFEYNRALEAEIRDRRIQIPVRECDQQPNCDILYEFDSRFNLLSVVASDPFRIAHREFYLNAKNKHDFNKAEENAFRAITCLSGCDSAFRSEP